ncbi:hypothetical protein Tco_1179233 [Tanacetum coccineum]
MEDNSWSWIMLNDRYNTFYKDEAQEDEETEKYLSMVEFKNGKAKLMVCDEMWVYYYSLNDKGKGKVDDLQNIVERLEGDLAMVIQVKQAEHDKGKVKHADHDLDNVDLVYAHDLENIIKKLEEDFSRKIAMTGCVLGSRAHDDPNAPPPLASRKRKP